METLNNETSPFSKTVMFRVLLDVVLGGAMAALPVYMATSSVRTSLLTGLLVAGKTLQSRLAPSPDEMNVQHQQAKAEAAVVASTVSSGNPVAPPAPAPGG